MDGFGQHIIQYYPQYYAAPVQRKPLSLAWDGVASSPGRAYEERIKCILSVLREKSMGMSAAELLCRVLSRNTEHKAARTFFMRDARQMGHLLQLIAQDEVGRKTLEGWLRSSGIAADVVCADVDEEMESVKADMSLKVKHITYDSVNDFDFKEHVTGLLTTCAPNLSRVLYTAARGIRTAKKKTYRAPDFVCGIVFAQLCNSRSKLCIKFQQIMGLFLYSTGASKQALGFLSKCGLSVSYSSVLRIHETLKHSLMNRAKAIARGPHMLGLDNEQICMSTHVTQRPGAEATVRSFTAAIIYPLRTNYPPGCFDLQAIVERRKNSPIITFQQHIRPSVGTAASIANHFITNIIEVLFRHVEGLDPNDINFKRLLQHETHRSPPEGLKTVEYILPTLQYDESTVAGLTAYKEQIYKTQLEVPDSILNNLAILAYYDQLSNNRDRGGFTERRGDETPFLRMENTQLGMGLWHGHLNEAYYILLIHRGEPDVPGSLSFYRDLLGIRRIQNDRPDYYTMRSFYESVFSGNMLCAWEKKTGFTDLEEYAKTNPSPEQIKKTATDILTDFASDFGLEACSGPTDDDKDVVLRNTILLNRDLLLFFEFDKAMSSGDFGRVEILFGTLTCFFNGSGGKNYSIEFLHLIQNLTLSWPPRFADIMRDHMLINMSGHPGHFMGVDLNMEHNIAYQKYYFAGKGVHGTAEHLARITPVTGMFRMLREKFVEMANSSWRGTTHTEPNREPFVTRIQTKAREARIYDVDLTRNKATPSKDVWKAGAQTLEKSGLKSFKKKYIAWANRRVGEMPECAPDMNEEERDPFEGVSMDGALILEEIIDSDDESEEELMS